MKALVALLAVVVAAFTLAGLPVAGAHAESGLAAPRQHPMPEATKKKTPKPTATPSSPVTATPVATPTRRPVDEEGERWVQIAMVAGGGLLGVVLVFFAIGSLLRYTGRRRSAG